LFRAYETCFWWTGALCQDRDRSDISRSEDGSGFSRRCCILESFSKRVVVIEVTLSKMFEFLVGCSVPSLLDKSFFPNCHHFAKPSGKDLLVPMKLPPLSPEVDFFLQLVGSTSLLFIKQSFLISRRSYPPPSFYGPEDDLPFMQNPPLTVSPLSGFFSPLRTLPPVDFFRSFPL